MSFIVGFVLYTVQNEWMNEWMSEWMNESMNEWMNEWMNMSHSLDLQQGLPSLSLNLSYIQHASNSIFRLPPAYTRIHF